MAGDSTFAGLCLINPLQGDGNRRKESMQKDQTNAVIFIYLYL